MKNEKNEKMSLIPESVLQDLINNLNNPQPMTTIVKANFINSIQSKSKEHKPEVKKDEG